jgi:hypothetical protein
MGKFFKKCCASILNSGESIGVPIFLLGILALIVLLIRLVLGSQPNGELIGVMLGLFSVGLGFIAIGISAKSDKRHTERLDSIYTGIGSLLEGFNREQDIVKKSTGDVIVKAPLITATAKVVPPGVTAEKKSKEAAQKRLDEDTKRVGYVRGEVFQLEDGSWGLAWGGKYPL